jgi:hypothetical protein
MFALLDQNNSSDDYFQVSYNQAPVEDQSKYAGGAVIEAKPTPPALKDVKSTEPMSEQPHRPATARTHSKPTDVRPKGNSPCAVEYSIVWLAIVFLILFAVQPVK